MWRIFNNFNSCGMSNSCMRVEKGWPNPAADQMPVLTEFAKEQLQKCQEILKPSTKGEAVDLDKFMEISNNLPVKFGTETCRVKSQPAERRQFIREQIASAYPIVHELALLLYMNFLEHKLKFGTDKERSIYKNMTITQFVQRLLDKRCVYFVGGSDSYKLLDNSSGNGGFEKIGTDNERAPLVLQNVLSYDEIKLSALLYVSTHSEFINNGSRSNEGVVEQNKSKIETDGVIVGLIGARFEREDVMEYQDILITERQNTRAHGYGLNSSSKALSRADNYRRIWCEFYQEPKDFCYSDIEPADERFVKVRAGYMDKLVMGKRYAITFDSLLIEAEARAVAAGKPAYIHVVGIGLGVWRISDTQEEIFFEAFEQRLRALSSKLLNIGVVHFSWFHLMKWYGMYNGAIIDEPKHPKGGIKVRISSRNPADKLTENMLPIVTYAWDGNALPGNEFWAGMLGATGDPAAACSTLITELQTSHINKDYMSGNNLHVASMQHGLLHIADYAKTLLAADKTC